MSADSRLVSLAVVRIANGLPVGLPGCWYCCTLASSRRVSSAHVAPPLAFRAHGTCDRARPATDVTDSTEKLVTCHLSIRSRWENCARSHAVRFSRARFIHEGVQQGTSDAFLFSSSDIESATTRSFLTAPLINRTIAVRKPSYSRRPPFATGEDHVHANRHSCGVRAGAVRCCRIRIISTRTSRYVWTRRLRSSLRHLLLRLDLRGIGVVLHRQRVYSNL